VTRLIRNLLISAALCLVPILLTENALGQKAADETQGEAATFSVRPVLGLQVPHPNAPGSITVQEGMVRFENTKHEVLLLSITSIQDLLLSRQRKQVGGVPMTLGKAAIPFGGGRAVSLVSHKTYDDVAIVYRDDNGAIHGVIFELPAEAGLQLRKVLVSHGAVVGPDGLSTQATRAEVGSGNY